MGSCILHKHGCIEIFESKNNFIEGLFSYTPHMNQIEGGLLDLMSNKSIKATS